MGTNPKVSFIVPCYKLAHLLPECVASILSQSYEDFEVLIMDDCSPDNTPEVAQSFRDPRVQHIRNEPNLRHLRNYNKGIGLAKGEYIWLISADDSLRSAQVLEQYVQILDGNQKVGYVFCPAMKVVDGKDAGVMTYSEIASHDTTLSGRKFLTQHLVFANIVPAPAAIVRKRCYEEVSLFPLDLPHAGDWYLWGMFALYFDVSFCAAAMVNRRFHAANMSTEFYKEATAATFADNLNVLKRIRERAQEQGLAEVASACTKGMVAEYVRQATPPTPGDAVQAYLTPQEFEESLKTYLGKDPEQARVRALVYAGLGDEYYARNDYARALTYYQRALLHDGSRLDIRFKSILAKMGRPGSILRETLSALKRHTRGGPV